jgi:hypothetical protein
MALSNEELKNCVSSYVMKLLSVSIKVHSLVYVWMKVMRLQKTSQITVCVRYFDVDKNLYSLKVYLNLTAFLVCFIQSGHRNPTVTASAATGKISVRTTGLERAQPYWSARLDEWRFRLFGQSPPSRKSARCSFDL